MYCKHEEFVYACRLDSVLFKRFTKHTCGKFVGRVGPQFSRLGTQGPAFVCYAVCCFVSVCGIDM